MNNATIFDTYNKKHIANIIDNFKIKFSNYDVQIVPYGSFVTCDYRLDRIRIYLDEHDLIERISIG